MCKVKAEQLECAPERGFKLLGVHWAPLKMPLCRRLQTAAVLFYVTLWFLLPIVCIWLPPYILLFTNHWPYLLLYVLWMLYDRDAPRTGGRCWPWFRQCGIWTSLRDYFPLTLHKTADLDPGRNYIIGVHPHGILSVGGFTSFCTDATGFSKLFPGITTHMMSLVGQFWFPFRREFPLLVGAMDVSVKSLDYVLSHKGGRAAVIVIGGAVEVLEAHQAKNAVNLKNRKGFVKLALKHGADLVPVYSFGENDLFHQFENPVGSSLRKVQLAMKKYVGFPLPIFYGRGIFNYSFGILPFRRPVHTVVGAPIRVEKNPNPTTEQVKDLQQKYVDGLVKLFEENKTKFGLKSCDQLEIL